jgi:hypothetical protein
MPFTSKKARVGLWIIQGALAALFLFAGGFKLAMPLATLAKLSPLPALFLKFIGLCEVSGAFGLVLPGIFRVRADLTPLAAAGLVIIMIGATVTTVLTQGVGAAVVPCVVGLLAATVVRGRWQTAPELTVVWTPARPLAHVA